VAPVDREHELPIIPLKELVVFPHSPIPLTVGSPGAKSLVESLQTSPSEVFMVRQRDSAHEPWHRSELYEFGTIAVLHPLRGATEAAGRMVIAQGTRRARLVDITQHAPFMRGRVVEAPETLPSDPDPEYRALEQNINTLFTEIVANSPVLSNDLIDIAANLEPRSAVVDFVSGILPTLSVDVRQRLLETLDVRRRMQLLMEELVKERENQDVQAKIREQVHDKLADSQRELFLREQLKAIQRELGEVDPAQRDASALEQRIEAAGLPPEAKAEAARELSRLREMPAAAAEYSVIRNYLDWLITLPWSVSTAAEVDLGRAQLVLDDDHYNLEKVKERVLEYLAVLKLKPDLKGPILCFVGPPGVGKTSLGRSIARSLGRKFARVSLGGIQDEAEIRGHRRTYVGAMPGQVIHALKQAGSNDPVFMLDELDKLGRDFRGDPAAALLEVLDPEQNSTFRDNYLDLPFDLSRVLFIATANMLDTVPPALKDRMEVVELPGYTDEEKLNIAQRFLLPRQAVQNGLALGADIRFGDDAIMEIIHSYTREAGVRGLERQIGSLFRKQARIIAGGARTRLELDALAVRARLGPPPFWIEAALEDRVQHPGVAVGLAWTPAGGDIIFVEGARMAKGSGKLTITGQLGETMQESTLAAMTWLKANAGGLKLEPADFRHYDVHVHVPAGGVPKDGPSAGLTMVIALYSLFTSRALRPFLAFTGEVTLSGRVLPVGGVKEKVLAARRTGVRELVLPAQNAANVNADIPERLRANLTIRYVTTIDEAIAYAFPPAEARRAA
jgi:ATP-dependent Lon protease